MSDPSYFAAVCKKEFLLLANDNDQLPISNLGALRIGLEALQKEDAQDWDRARELWGEAKKLLTDEAQDDEGAGAQGSVLQTDLFAFYDLGCW